MHNYRKDGKVRHKTIMNLSKWSDAEVNALDRMLKGERSLTHQDIELGQGKSIGAIWILKQLAEDLGIVSILGNDRQSRIMLLLIVSRIITQGSRRHALHWAETQSIDIVFGLTEIKKDELYDALDRLSERQSEIEERLFKQRYANNPPSLYLYDVTSSYIEGDQNECGHWGYNRDGKKGTKQIVIGLLMAEDGIPIAVDVFEGNTSDTATVSTQIHTLTQRFQVGKVTLVGDKGMIKGPQIEALSTKGISYITSITKSQIRTLIHEGTVQLSLFDDQLVEVRDGNIRYILRRNPTRESEMRQARDSKLACIEECVAKENALMAEKPKRKHSTSQLIIMKKIESLKYSKMVSLHYSDNRIFSLIINEEEKATNAQLDGCYVLKTNLSLADKSTQSVHQSYKQLAIVESAFRTIKTTCLEVRPIYVRKKSRTRGHVFLTMLSFMIVTAFNQKTTDIPKLTTEEKISILDHIHLTAITIFGKTIIKIPTLPPIAKQILERLNISMPSEVSLNKTMCS